MVVFGAKFRTLAIASALLGLVTTQANACAIGHSVNVFFDHVPEEDIDGFVVLEATLVESHSLIDKTKEWMLMGRARVDKVIKGQIDVKTVKLFRYMDPCGMFASGTTHGIVVGTIRNGTQDELEVLSEFQWDIRAQAFRERKEWRVPERVPWPGLSGPSTPWPLFEKGVDARDIGERSDAVPRTAMPAHDGDRR
jgi:hypothetical protein